MRWLIGGVAVVGLGILVVWLMSDDASAAAAAQQTNATPTTPDGKPTTSVSTLGVNQLATKGFDKNRALAAIPDSTWPVPGYRRISPGYGFGTLRGNKRFHTGIDISAPKGTPVYAPMAGTVGWLRDASDGGSCGNGLGLNAGSLQVWMCHFSRITVKQGQKVRKGQRIGEIGSTGNSTGPHLHLSVRWKIDGKWQNVNPERRAEEIIG